MLLLTAGLGELLETRLEAQFVCTHVGTWTLRFTHRHTHTHTHTYTHTHTHTQTYALQVLLHLWDGIHGAL